MIKNLLSKLFLAGSFVLLLGCLASCALDNRVIEKPVYLARNTTSIEVSKVTLTDSTTVLDIYAKYRPKYWIRISPNSFLTDDKGNTHPITTSIGMELGKEFWMPESGEAEFQLVFPRLRKGAKYFNFSEDPAIEGGYKIWGVQLQGNELPKLALSKEIQLQEVDKDATLTVPELKYGKAVVKGKLLDYQPGMPSSIKLVCYNPLVGYDGDVEVAIKDDGTFEHQMDVLVTSKAYLYYEGMNARADIFLEADKVSEVYLNLQEASRLNSKFHADAEPYGRLYYYSGPMQNVVRELQELQALTKTVQNKSVAYDFNAKPEVLLELYKNNLFATLEAGREALSQSSLGKSVKMYSEGEGAFELFDGLAKAPSRLAYEYLMTQTEMDREAYYQKMAALQQACPSDYVDEEYFKRLNDPMSLLYSSYGHFIGMPDEIQEKYALSGGLYAQMNLTAGIYRRIKEFAPLTDEQKETMKSLPEACQQYLMAMNDQLLQTIEANKKKTGFRVNEAGEVADEDLFASIISKYRGKVVLVDFWATWCGPCRMANKEMKPMKEDLKDKDIVYVYITGETSPKGTWESMIPDIHGEHYRVTDKQWAYLGNAMGVEGVPTYLVIDREGNIKYKSVGFPGVAKMKEELQKVLNN